MRRSLPLLLLLLLCLATGVAAESPAGSMTADVEKAIFEKTNQFRIKHHLTALTKSAERTDAASKFAKFMAKSEKYGHRADGTSPAKRAIAAGYKYCVVRENITMTHCFPTMLSLKDKGVHATLRESADLIVTGEAIKRQEESVAVIEVDPPPHLLTSWTRAILLWI